MYSNLKFEMERKNITRKEIAKLLGIELTSLSSRIDGNEFFKFHEALKIQKNYFPDIAMEYLFESDKKKGRWIWVKFMVLYAFEKIGRIKMWFKILLLGVWGKWQNLSGSRWMFICSGIQSFSLLIPWKKAILFIMYGPVRFF